MRRLPSFSVGRSIRTYGLFLPTRSAFSRFKSFKLFMVGREGFEPSKATPADLQSAAIDHSATYPLFCSWSRREESNPRQADYKSAALPTELRRHNFIFLQQCRDCQRQFYGTPAYLLIYFLKCLWQEF